MFWLLPTRQLVPYTVKFIAVLCDRESKVKWLIIESDIKNLIFVAYTLINEIIYGCNLVKIYHVLFIL